jgi:hypothetical protein
VVAAHVHVAGCGGQPLVSHNSCTALRSIPRPYNEEAQ